jgi:hypothetical protein
MRLAIDADGDELGQLGALRIEDAECLVAGVDERGSSLADAPERGLEIEMEPIAMTASRSWRRLVGPATRLTATAEMLWPARPTDGARAGAFSVCRGRDVGIAPARLTQPAERVDRRRLHRSCRVER